MVKEAVTGRPKAMTKSEVIAALAEKVGISKKQASQFLEAQAELAYQQARNVGAERRFCHEAAGGSDWVGSSQSTGKNRIQPE